MTVLPSRSIEQRYFCEQLRRVSDSIENVDVLTTLICEQLLVQLLSRSRDEQQPQQSRHWTVTESSFEFRIMIQ